MNPHARGGILGIVLVLVLCSSIAAYVLFRSGLVETGGEGVFETGPCELIAMVTTTVYARPDRDASVSGFLSSQEKVGVSGITAKGWFGFDPGVAHTVSIGPFRLRYIAPDTGARLSGNCADVPTVITLPPFVCFTMAGTVTPIYSRRSSTSSIVAVMHLGDYVEVTGKTDVEGAHDFVRVDSREGSLPGDIVGWVEGSSTNLNGACGRLPHL